MLYRNLGAAAAVIGLAVIIVTLLALAPWSDHDGSAGGVLQGDTDCSGEVDPLDALGDLRRAGDIPPFPDCVDSAGDVDCSGGIDAGDAVDILAYVVDTNVANPAGGCTPIGEVIVPTATHSPTVFPTITNSPPPTSSTQTAVPTPTQSPCLGPGGGPSLPGDPGGDARPSLTPTAPTPCFRRTTWAMRRTRRSNWP